MPHLPRRPLSRVASVLGAAGAAGALGVGSGLVAPLPAADAVSTRAQQRAITYTQFDSAAQWNQGKATGAVVDGGILRFDAPVRTRTYGGRSYDVASWTSPWVTPGAAFTQLVASWKASTPGDSWIEISVRGRRGSGTSAVTGSWDVLGRWTSGDTWVHRSTVTGQADDVASVDVDTWKAKAPLAAYQLSVALMRRHGGSAKPSVDTVGAVASALPAAAGPVSKPGVARGVDLKVPGYSQMLHDGEYPQYNGGGEAWCSPTSTTMVLAYYRALPKPSSYTWVPKGHHDPYVDAAARKTYDFAYEGTGNWPFNTAYAAPLAGHAFVTRLRSLHEAERFIAAGIPLVASISFGPGELDGAPISSTRGHLTVIRGFTKSGDPIVNDPAASTDAGVRHVYDRAQYERAWLEGSGGTVYVIHDDAHPLPTGAQTNW